MAIGASVIYNGSYHSPGFDIAVTGLTGKTRLWIQREDPSGFSAPVRVRGADDITISSINTFAITDYEAPVNPYVQYRVVGYVYPFGSIEEVVTPAIQSAFTNHGEVWLKSVSQPALSRRVNMVDWSDRSTPGRILGEYPVLGRKNKVVITDVLGGREGSFILTTYLEAPNAWAQASSPWDLEALLTEGQTLMIQTTGLTFTGEPDMYFEVKNVSRRRTSLTGAYGNAIPFQQTDLVFEFTIDYIEVDRPATTQESLGLRGWQDVLNQNATWQKVLDDHTTWLDTLQRNL